MAKIKIAWSQVSITLLVALLAIGIWQSFQISALKGDLKVAIGTSGAAIIGGATSVEQILAEITPTGTPDYGREAGVSYDSVESSLRTLVGYDSSILLSGSDKERYIEIATAQDTACEYCCGIGDAGFGTADGRIACGCSHNVAFSGLTKWLIKNSDYNNKQIIDEVGKWKILFFPQGALEDELAKRDISPQSIGLPSMRGGC